MHFRRDEERFERLLRRWPGTCTGADMLVHTLFVSLLAPGLLDVDAATVPAVSPNDTPANAPSVTAAPASIPPPVPAVAGSPVTPTQRPTRATTVTPSAEASAPEVPAPGVHRHDGFYLRLGLG